MPWPYNELTNGTRPVRSDKPPPRSWENRTARELTSTSYQCWPDGEPINTGALIRLYRLVVIQGFACAGSFEHCALKPSALSSFARCSLLRVVLHSSWKTEGAGGWWWVLWGTVGRFSSQPGVRIRTRSKLTVQQRITSQQNEGQSVGSVTWRHKAERAAREMEVRLCLP